MEFADFHRGLENKLKPEKGGFPDGKPKKNLPVMRLSRNGQKKPMAEECLESIFILKISCELLCLMVYPSGIYMPCELVSVMIQWC